MGIYVGLLERLPSCRGFWSFSRQNSPWLQVACLPLAWVKQRDHFSAGWEPESSPVSLTAIPFPAGAFPNGMLQCGKVGWQRGFKPCFHCARCLVGTAGQSLTRDMVPSPTVDAKCTSVATAADGHSSILAALIKLQKLCMLSVMRRPFINSVIKAIKHDPLVLTSLMAG